MFSPHAFSRAWRQLHVFASNSDWLVVLFTSVAIGQTNYFGFGFTTLNRKPLYIAIAPKNLRIAYLQSFCLYNDVNVTEGMNTGCNRHKTGKLRKKDWQGSRSVEKTLESAKNVRTL